MKLLNIFFLKITPFIFASTSLILLTGCVQNSLANQDIIRINGSSTVYPITLLAAKQFEGKQSQTLKIKLSQDGTEAGFTSFCEGKTDINDASRPILLREIDACKQNGIAYVELPIAFDAVTIVVNSQNTWAKDISTKELGKLWEPSAKGKIKSWNQVRASWPNQPIHLYGPDNKSGTMDYFTIALGLPEHGVRKDFVGDSNAAVLAQKVGNDPLGIGYFGYGYYLANANHLRALAVDSGKGAVLPSQETVHNAQYQPFSRPLLLYVNSQSAQSNSDVKAFVEFFLGHTTDLVKEASYIPLPEEAEHMNTVHFYDNKVGTVFAGEPKPGVTIPQLLRKQAIF